MFVVVLLGGLSLGRKTIAILLMVAVCLGFLLGPFFVHIDKKVFLAKSHSILMVVVTATVAPLTGDSDNNKLITALVLFHCQYFSKWDNHQCFEFTNNPCILYDGWLRLTAFVNMRDDIYYVDPFLG